PTRPGAKPLSDSLRIELRSRSVQVGVGYFLLIKTPLLDGPGSELLPVLERGLGWPMQRGIPVERAWAAIVAGIERRSRRVYTPGLVGPMLPLRQLLAPVIEQQ